jgi:hypothetical protein
LLLSPLTTQEAVLSSKIEGTQATLGEVLKFEAGRSPSRSLGGKILARSSIIAVHFGRPKKNSELVLSISICY